MRPTILLFVFLTLFYICDCYVGLCVPLWVYVFPIFLWIQQSYIAVLHLHLWWFYFCSNRLKFIFSWRLSHCHVYFINLLMLRHRISTQVAWGLFWCWTVEACRLINLVMFVGSVPPVDENPIPTVRNRENQNTDPKDNSLLMFNSQFWLSHHFELFQV